MGLVRAALSVVGLAPAGQVKALSGRVDAADGRAAELKRALSEAREEIGRWKAKAAELSERLARAQEGAERLPKIERELQQWKGRDEKHLGQLGEVRERMERAERAIALSREHLMATETKLDIIEGAINVLDTRTRAALQPAESESSTSMPART